MSSVVGLDLVSLLVYAATGLLSPFLVDVVTKRFASTRFKSVTLLVINLLTGLAVSFGDAHDAGVTFDWKSGLTAAAISFLAGVAGVFHFKAINIIGADSVLATRGGIGREDPSKVAKHDAVPVVPVPVEQPPAEITTPAHRHSGLDGY